MTETTIFWSDDARDYLDRLVATFRKCVLVFTQEAIVRNGRDGVWCPQEVRDGANRFLEVFAGEKAFDELMELIRSDE